LRKAVPPNPVDFVESTGLAAVVYGPDSHEHMDKDFAPNVWKMQNPISWQIALVWVIGSRRAGGKLATDARHDRSPRAGVSARLNSQLNWRARR
jgi:hypothetical protein